MSDILDINQMTEEDIKLQYITPALIARWDIKKITMETGIYKNQVQQNKKNFIV